MIKIPMISRWPFLDESIYFLISLDYPRVYYGWIYSKTNVLFKVSKFYNYEKRNYDMLELESVWMLSNLFRLHSNLLESNRLKLFLLVFRWLTLVFLLISGQKSHKIVMFYC